MSRSLGDIPQTFGIGRRSFWDSMRTLMVLWRIVEVHGVTKKIVGFLGRIFGVLLMTFRGFWENFWVHWRTFEVYGILVSISL